MGLRAGNDPRSNATTVGNKFYVKLSDNLNRLVECVEELECDKFPFNDKKERQQRATGCAISIALSVADVSGFNTRFAVLQGGPCTIGPGRVVGLPLKETLRTFMDINDNNDNVRYFKNAKKFYEGLETKLIRKHTVDIWAYGLDQSGLLEMKNLAEKTGGIIAMHELFNHFIFDNSFSLHY